MSKMLDRKLNYYGFQIKTVFQIFGTNILRIFLNFLYSYLQMCDDSWFTNKEKNYM